MAYNFTIQSSDPRGAKLAVSDQLDEEFNISQQDRAHVVALAGTFIDLLPFDDTKDILVTVEGSHTGAGFRVHASLIPRVTH